MANLKLVVVAYTEAKTLIQTIRHLVFQVEQGVTPALDFDGLDAESQHILASINGHAVGTTRLRHLNEQTVKIERLAVLPEFRNQGIGRQIMEAALEFLTQSQVKTVQLHAQLYIKDLYQKLGFVQVGDVFDEAGILHVKMQKQLREFQE
ncbi:MAG: GNAT family N-acetyltransferase [Trichocoleus desertorum ATA4-8-CV12]|jgi:predicted GNAT family N-acyltransferase|nr:GNAT family N-acetyltransferase [Trichocoleus desertorum ATA4-8-CV12]